MQRYGAFTAAHTQLAEEDYPETLAATLSSDTRRWTFAPVGNAFTPDTRLPHVG
jgi:hypothetical protein